MTSDALPAPEPQLPGAAVLDRPRARDRVRAFGESERLHRWAPWAALSAVTGLALALNAWGLSQAGYGNTYYAAAARSMTMSWTNFLFGAFDPGGFITVDKPPAFLWVGALSARVFGYSSWSLLLPSAVAGASAVALLWSIMRSYFGTVAATIAAIVLALTPISVAVDRLNLPEPFFILALVGAAGAVLRSLDSRRWWAWVALAGVAVGVAFNTKMLAGWIPGPAMVAAVLVGVAGGWRASWRQWLPRLAVLGVVTLLVSASWMVVVDLWPASNRPYIGGSTNNTVQQLVFGYNGFERVEGQGFGGGGARPPANAARSGTTQPRNGGGFGQGVPNGVRGAGGIIAGEPGPWRMFDAANGGQIAWFLPFAVLGGAFALWTWRRDRLRRAAVVLWLGWVLLYAGVFSYAQGIYHSYYTSALAPGVAALVGITFVSVLDAVRHERRWLAVAAILVGVTLAVQLTVAGRVPEFYGWVRPFTIGLAVAGLVLLAYCLVRRGGPVVVGLALSVFGLLLLPAAWTFSVTAHASLNTTLPQAGPREGAAGSSFGSQAFDDGTRELAAWLQAHNDSTATWQLVVTSAQNASTLIADYGVSVMALGGFSGNDPAATLDELAGLVTQGEVRYVSVNGGTAAFGRLFGTGNTFVGPGTTQIPGQAPFAQPGDGQRGTTPDGRGSAAPRQGAFGNFGPGGGNSSAGKIMSAVERTCVAVTDSTLPAQYRGSLYDCSGKGEALAALG
jgi:4-amino-4-deoxy-L-arabinose transferase-like glycosyltransferase